MQVKITIRKVLFVALWLSIGAGMLTLLLAANSKKNKGVCRNYLIQITGDRDRYFIDEAEAEDMLEKAAGGSLKGKRIADMDLHTMEEVLEKNHWIQNAELYVDNQDVLHVTITEKSPVARVFTRSGSSFYIDGQGKRLPLSAKRSARVLVFTGFPDSKKLSAGDSLLLKNVIRAAEYIVADPFWLAQVAQMDITAEGQFEMIPVVGNHSVKMGTGDLIGNQFQRLMVFYRQVLSKTGFDYYKYIDVQYRGQVVASRTGGETKVDSLRLRRNVEQLLRQSREADTVMRVLPVIMPPLPADAKDSIQAGDLPPAAEPASTNPNPVPLKLSAVQPKQGKKADAGKMNSRPSQQKKPATGQKPKAVMPPRTTEDPDGGYE